MSTTAQHADETPMPLEYLIPRVPTISVQQAVHVIQQQAVITPQRTATDHLAVAGENWTWQQLRDYVVTGIERTLGHPLPNRASDRARFTEQSIFSSFLTRHGAADSSRIAKHVFENLNGYWRNAPVSVNRFCLNSDQYFAKPILEHLAASDAAKAARV